MAQRVQKHNQDGKQTPDVEKRGPKPIKDE